MGECDLYSVKTGNIWVDYNVLEWVLWRKRG